MISHNQTYPHKVRVLDGRRTFIVSILEWASLIDWDEDRLDGFHSTRGKEVGGTGLDLTKYKKDSIEKKRIRRKVNLSGIENNLGKKEAIVSINALIVKGCLSEGSTSSSYEKIFGGNFFNYGYHKEESSLKNKNGANMGLAVDLLNFSFTAQVNQSMVVYNDRNRMGHGLEENSGCLSL
ncbi:hypothetical protein QYF36_011334 [Acer negundo]|nr:hypothetical protein QYF36_011334 [Acer negundo]